MRVAEKLGRKMPQVDQNWLSTEDIMALLQLADFEPIKREWRTLTPMRTLGVGTIINRFAAPLPCCDGSASATMWSRGRAANLHRSGLPPRC